MRHGSHVLEIWRVLNQWQTYSLFFCVVLQPKSSLGGLVLEVCGWNAVPLSAFFIRSFFPLFRSGPFTYCMPSYSLFLCHIPLQHKHPYPQRDFLSFCVVVVVVVVFSCNLHFIRCLDSTAFCILSLLTTHNNNIHAAGGVFPQYFICTSLSWLSAPFILYCTTHTSVLPAGFELAIPAVERPQTYALGRVASWHS
jgi:hypothetical protein